MEYQVVEGDLLDQEVDAIVNAWNRNTVPWWLLPLQGASGAIKKRGGTEPFKEVAKAGRMRLGQAVATGAGRLPFKAIIHVCGIDGLWRASVGSIEDSVKNAVALAEKSHFRSLAIPVIGAGSGGFEPAQALRLMKKTLDGIEAAVSVRIVVYKDLDNTPLK